MRKEGLTFGRSPSMAAKHMGETSDNTIGAFGLIICRTYQNRPENENAIRGMI